MADKEFVVVQPVVDRRFTRTGELVVYDRAGNDMTDHYPVLKRGRSLATTWPRVFLRRRDKKKGADFLDNLYLLPVVNQRVRAALQQSGIRNIEYYPVEIVDKTGEQTTHAYKFLNVIGMYPLIDWEKSKWRPLSPEYPLLNKLIEKVVLRHDADPEVDLFWLEEPRELVVAGDAASCFLDKKFSGVRIIRLLDYRDELA